MPARMQLARLRVLRVLRSVLASLLLCGLTPSMTHAHVMVAQKGTLNIVDDGAFMVLSLPISAFSGIDDDGDARLSPTELRLHVQAIVAQVQANVRLVNGALPLPLQGVFMHLSPAHDSAGGSADQIVVMGRFAVPPNATDLRLTMGLFGRDSTERQLDVTVTRQAQRHVAHFEPGHDTQPMLPSPWTLLKDNLSTGSSHVLQGPDHLLFLLVVLFSGWGFRQLGLALTCFTLGHASTLSIVAFIGLALPSAVVEPAIAATIAGMVLFDAVQRKRAQSKDAVRMVLVFACALIHGLGLASAFNTAGMDPTSLWWSLAGFNLGIEFAQLGLALVAGALWWAWLHTPWRGLHVLVPRLASGAAFLVGSFWFVQRVVQVA